ncbi:TipJ family phage tail tip protein [Shewanella xiamenensis]|uniref:TipJ family phage tail tip protein n=1 Tax=Shewanella xiamenensis TaxID=332186 RepID=UPI00313CD48E
MPKILLHQNAQFNQAAVMATAINRSLNYMGIPALKQLVIHGAKAGESEQRTPVESPDDLRSIAKAKILLAIGEGEFEGQLSGQNVFLDGTPLLDANGAENFPGVIWDFRPGSVHQTYIPGVPAVENEVALGIELKSEQPYTRAITNSLLSAVRVRFRWPALQQQLDNGDVNGYRIEYAIDLSTDGGSYQTVLSTAVDGKTTQPYERSHRIDLPAGNSWQIRIRRLTPNQNNNRVADLMQIAAITDVIDRKLKYPNTALLYVEFDASQFQNIPVVSCEPFMRKVRVPTNYNPLTSEYTGVWDGSFKIAWTDNPAWVSYDIILDDRFGTGRRINASLVDKWELYQIAQYCDQLVPDGKGGMEPRYICNIYIQQAAEAWQVLRDLASIYRGMTYWSNGQMYSVADMPRDMDFIYTNANVIDGKFSYSSSSEKVKYTRALISWDNPDNAYESDVTSVSDQALQRRYGDNVVELSALGCTRESEAQRRGKWAIYTNNNDRAVNFKVGMDGSIPLPGYVIGVADQLIAGSRIGGRISAVNGKQITLDRAATIAVNDRLIINLPSGKAQARTIEAVNGRVVTVTTEYSETPLPQLLWSVESDELKLQQFRVLRVAKANSDSIEYEITAVEHNPSKYPYIDTGARLEDRPISKLPVGAQEAPATVTISQSTFTEQTLSVTTMTIQWATAKNAVAYEVEWRKDSGEWVKLPKTSGTSVDIRGVYTGQYIARVRAINSVDVSSVPKSSDLTNITGKTGLPPAVASFTTTPLVFGIALNWLFPVGAEDTLRTEIEYGPNNNDSGMIKLGDFAYPLNSHTMTGLSAGVSFWFRARLVDRTGNVGPWSNFVNGQSSTDQTKYDEYFSERITSSALGQELLSEIELIPVIKVETDKIPDIENDIAVAQSKIDQMQADIADIAGAPDWDSNAAYLSGQLVKYQGKLYSAKQDVPAGTLPTNATYWTKIGEYSTIGEALAALTVRVDTVETSIEEIDGKLTAESSRIDGIFAQVNPPLAGDMGWNAGTTVVFAGVWSEQYARASADEALAKSIDAVSASIDKNTAAIITEQMARATADESLANQIISISATVNGNAALIKQEQTARADADSALGQRIDTVQATTGANTAAIQQEQTARANADSALGQRIDTVQATTGANTAAIQQEQTARANADSALGQRIDTVQATAGANTSAIQQEQTARANADSALGQRIDTVQATAGANTSAIQQEQTARANADSALGQRIDTVQATAGANTAAVQQTSTALAQLDGKLQAMYSIKVGVTADGKYYGAGMAIGVENTPEGMQSQVLFTADRFAIINQVTGTTTITTPFVVENGQVFMNSAFIGELQNKTLIQREGGFLSVYGAGFGVNNEFIDWYGPDVGDISNCSKSNAITYRTNNGDAYFGGTLSAGVLKNGASYTTKTIYTSAISPLTIGPFWTNGKTKNLVFSYRCTASYEQALDPGNLTNAEVLTMKVQRFVGSSWVDVPGSAITLNGNVEKTTNDENIPPTYKVFYSCSGSVTISDNLSNSTSDVTYRVYVSSHTRPFNNGIVNSQTLTLVSTEQ